MADVRSILDNEIHEESEFESTYNKVDVSESDFNVKKENLYKKTDGIDISRIKSRLTLRYYNNGIVSDKETIPIVKDGVSVGDIKEYYIRTDTEDTPSKDLTGWSNTIPSFNGTNKYLWNYEEEYNTKGELIVSTSPQLLSANGKEIAFLIEYYYRSDSTAVPQYTDLSKWSETPPDTSNGKYLWNLEYIVYPDGTTEKTIPQIISANGEDGEAIFTLVIYIRSSSMPSVPENSTYNLTTDELTDIGAWSRDIPEDNGYPCWQTISNISTRLESVSVTWNNPTKILDGSLYVSKYTPTYLGALSIAPTDANIGDFYLQLTLDTATGDYTNAKLVKWTGSEWEDVGVYSPSTAYYYNSALDDILTYADLSTSTATYASAFITHLFAKHIKATASIRVGNRYNEDGKVIDTSATGAYLGADGILKAYGAQIDGDEESTFNGYINVNKGLMLKNVVTNTSKGLYTVIHDAYYKINQTYFCSGIIRFTSALDGETHLMFPSHLIYNEDSVVVYGAMLQVSNTNIPIYNSGYITFPAPSGTPVAMIGIYSHNVASFVYSLVF